MANQDNLITMTVPESTARGALISGAGTLSATLRAIGVLEEPTDAGETKQAVRISGTALALYGATITAGKVCKSDANGKLVEVAGDGSDDYLACALTIDAGADGELGRVKVL